MNINRYTKIFIKNTLLGLGDVCLSLTNHDHLLHVVEIAYRDMQPRTFKKNVPNARIDALERKSVLFGLTEKFVEYFKGAFFSSQEQFDEWHEEICYSFVDEFNTKVMRSSGYKDIEYGKAQKIVNIAFKYLYLFCYVPLGDLSHFAFCHFIVDSYTLDWFKKKVDSNCKVKNWSDMTYNEYIKIQNDIRKYLSTQSKYPKEPFLAEFEIWSECANSK